MNENREGPWPGAKGVIPVTSKTPEDANVWARNYFDSILVEERIIGSKKANIETSFFSHTWSSPIVMPAFSHLDKIGIDGFSPMQAYALAAKDLNIINFVGMEEDKTIEEILNLNPNTFRIIKPFKDHERILHEIHFSEEHHALGVGIDIDHVFGKDGNYDVVDHQEMGTITLEDLKTYIHSTSLPFAVKGILSTRDALLAKEAGAKILVISTHHGRIPYGIPPLRLLPEIRKTVGKDRILILDGQVFSGYDIYKALALGADLVMVGRGILPELLKEGKEGVKNKVSKMNQQLMELMEYTSVSNLKEMDSSVLYYDGKRMG